MFGERWLPSRFTDSFVCILTQALRCAILREAIKPDLLLKMTVSCQASTSFSRLNSSLETDRFLAEWGETDPGMLTVETCRDQH